MLEGDEVTQEEFDQALAFAEQVTAKVNADTDPEVEANDAIWFARALCYYKENALHLAYREMKRS